MWVMASDFPAWCWAGSVKIDTRAPQFYVTFRLSIFFHYLCLVLLFYSVLGDSSLNRMPSQAATDCNKREIQVTTSLTGLGEETYACKPSNLVKWDSLCIQILDFFFNYYCYYFHLKRLEKIAFLSDVTILPHAVPFFPRKWLFFSLITLLGMRSFSCLSILHLYLYFKNIHYIVDWLLSKL